MTNSPDGSHFLDVLREDDHLLADAEEHLLAVIEGVKRTGKVGKVVLTLKINQPQNAAERAAVYITGSVDGRVPPPETEQHLFYEVGGVISRRDPRQPEMPIFRSVDKSTGEVLDNAQEATQ